jgi:hypothetical protein
MKSSDESSDYFDTLSRPSRDSDIEEIRLRAKIAERNQYQNEINNAIKKRIRS